MKIKLPCGFKPSFLKFSLYIILLFFIPMNTLAQISLDIKNMTLKEALKEIEKKTDYNFFYSEGLKNLSDKVSLQVTNETVEKALEILLKGRDISYQKQNDNIILLIPEIKSSENAENEIKKYFGTIRDKDGEPIIGASVFLKNSDIGTVTDLDGKFAITASSGSVLVVSYVGYRTTELTLNNNDNLSITINEDQELLDEVVVIGYGTVKKSDLTGAVSSVKTKDLPKASNTSISHMLAGQAAGLMVTQTSAQPGGGVEILIRGAASVGAGNAPLYVIDGFPITNLSVEPESGNRYEMGSRNPLNSINPNDIESIEILKDASSSAIYGARAANGVVLITTKRGKAGKPVVTYNMNLSTQKIAKRLDMLSSREFMQVSNETNFEKWKIDNELYPYGSESEEDAIPYKGDPFSSEQVANAGEGTDWFDLITRTGFIQQHNISISAGNEDTKYLFSLNYFDQDGIINESDFRRISGRINIDQRINKYINVGINATYSDIFNNNVPLGSGAAENSSLLNSALQFLPLVPVYDDEGNYSKNPILGQIPNPVSLLEITDQTNTQRLLANGYASVSFLEKFEAKISLGVDRNNGTRNTYLPQTTLYGAQEGGKANISTLFAQNLLGELTLKYSTKLFKERDHMDVLLGYSYEKEEYSSVGAGSSQFSSDLFLWNKLQSGNVARPPVSSGKAQDELASYFARINYSFLDKFLLTLSARYDGSTKFGANNKRAFFPSGAIAWKIHNENFLKNVDWLNNLKLRLGYGQTGNSNIGGNANEYFTVDNSYVFGEGVYSGSFRSQLGNPNLKWETTTELNIGLDFGFLKNRISGSFEYFDKTVSDLLMFRKLNSLMEVPTIADNVGSTQSQGFELSVNTVNFSGRFNWHTAINLSSYKDRWKERNPDVTLAPYERMDDQIRAIFGYLSDGILQIGETPPTYMPDLIPGQMKIKDVNGFDPDDNSRLIGYADGKINDADRVYLGSRDPKLIFGFGNTLSYANFDLNIFFYGVADQNIWNPNRSKYGSAGSEYILQGQNYSTEVLDRWTPDNPSQKFPSGFYSPYPSGDTWLMENIWYIRCKNITLGYTLPGKWKKNIFSNARIYIDLGSPFILTNYEGLDPEMDSMGGYPTQRTYSLGIDITF